MITWKDVTSYSRSEREPREPRAWEAVAAGVRLTIVNKHIHYPDHWVMTFFGAMHHEFTVPFSVVERLDIIGAQLFAVAKLRSFAHELLKELA